MARDRFAVLVTKAGHFWVIDRDTDRAVFDSPAASIARQMCIDKNLQTGGRPVAPKIACRICHDNGFIRDPDGRQAAEPCDCRWRTPSAARQAHAERFAFLDALHGQSSQFPRLAIRRDGWSDPPQS